MFISSFKPESDFQSFLISNPLLHHFKTKQFHLTLYNRKNEIPDMLCDSYNITLETQIKGIKPTLSEMAKSAQYPCIICNSDIEFNNINRILELTEISFDIASGGRRDYQWDKAKSKFQGRQTLDYFVINSRRGLELLSKIEQPLGSVKIDNRIISEALNDGLKVVDFTRAIKVYHRNHESFKISGRLNLDVHTIGKAEFQNSRVSTTNYRLGSLHYATNIVSIGGKYFTYNLPMWLKRFRYLLGRARIVIENGLEKKISRLIVKEDRKIQGYRYFICMYIPVYK